MTPQPSPEALEQIRAIVDAALGRVLATIDGRFNGIDSRFNGIDGRLDGIDGRFDGIDGRLDGIDSRFDEIDSRLDAGLAESRRHFGVIAENLKTKLELVIEGQIGLDQKLDREVGRLRSAIDGLDRRMVRLAARRR